MNTNSATAAIAGADSGSVIRRITPQCESPSMSPASSSETGIEAKYERSM